MENPSTEITLILADSQIRQQPGTGPEQTIVSRDLWKRYQLRAKALGEKCADFDEFLRRNKRAKKPKSLIQMPDGHPVLTYGPFVCRLNIGPIPVRMPVYVTSDPHFGTDFILGRNDWPTMPLKTMQVLQETPYNEAHVRCQGGPEGVELRTLVDTGAGINVLSYAAFCKMGYQRSDLQPSRFRLAMADSTDLATMGFFPSLEVRVLDTHLQISCTVVDGLGYDDLILGREFLTRYDVLLDLPRRELTIRNPYGRNKIVRKLQEQPEARFMATPTLQAKIAPETISCVNYKIKASQRATKGGRVRKRGAWLATVEPVDTYYQNRQIAIPKAVLTVRDGEAPVPLLNAAWQEEHDSELPPQLGRLRVKQVFEIFEREVVDEKVLDEEQVFTLGAEGEVLDYKSAVPDPDSDIDSYCTSEPPVETSKKPTSFPTRPPTEHLAEKISPDSIKELGVILDEYQDIFCKDKTDIGFTHLEEHDIELVPGAEPHKESYRRLLPDKRESADKQVEELLNLGMISPSKSPISSGVVMVKKTDGTYRMCIDFRKLNSVTKKDAFPLPRIDETLDRLGDAKYFTTLDMGSGFWQVPLTERAKETTAFVTHKGQYQWNRMPFGLCNATATFQRLMSKVLASVAQHYGNIVLCYVDDILIATKTEQQHLEQLRAVFGAVRRANLKLKAAKCKLFDTEIKFLGRVVTGEGIKPDPESIRAVQEWKTPTNKKELASFLGLSGYYREFIKGYASIIAPLQALKKQNAEYIWGDEQQQAFEKLKETLVNPPVLAMPSQDGEYVLDTDASDVAIAGILHQWQYSPEVDKQVLRVIGYASRSLTDAQTRYGAAKLEMFAALKMIEKFAPYLANKRFLLRVDCSALSWLRTYGVQQNSLGARWIARLEGYYFRVEQRSRARHQNADGLSKRTNDLEPRDAPQEIPQHAPLPFLEDADIAKLPELEPECQQGDEELPAPILQTAPLDNSSQVGVLRQPEGTGIADVKAVRALPRYTVDHLLTKQLADPTLKIIRAALELPPETSKPKLRDFIANLTETEKKWFNKNKERLRINEDNILVLHSSIPVDPVAIVLPEFFRFEIMQETHDQLGHQGANKTAEKMARHHQWPGYREDVKRYVASCMLCQEAKPPQKTLRTKLQPITTASPGELVMIDYEKLTQAYDGSVGVLMMIDHFSKYCVAVPVKAFTAAEAANAIWYHWVQLCGIPDVIHSDKGSHFENALMQELLLQMGCVKTHTSGYHPQGNGLVERLNKTIVKCLSLASAKDQREWPSHLIKVTMSYNMMKQESTGFSPYRLMYGREAKTPLSLLFPAMQRAKPVPAHEYVKTQVADMARVAEIVRKNVRTAQIRQVRNHDKRISNTPVLKEGQWAMVYVDVVRKDHTGKMTRKWRGPWRVLHVQGDGLLYMFNNGHKAHFERVRLFEPRMRHLKVGPKWGIYIPGHDGERDRRDLP